MEYSASAMKYLATVDGHGHMSAVEIINELEAVVTTLHNQAISAKAYYTADGQHINRTPHLNLAGARDILRVTAPVMRDAAKGTP